MGGKVSFSEGGVHFSCQRGLPPPSAQFFSPVALISIKVLFQRGVFFLDMGGCWFWPGGRRGEPRPLSTGGYMLNYCFGIYLQELHWDLRGLDIHLIWSIRGKTSPSRFNWPRNYPLFSVQFISMVFQATSEADLLEASSEAEPLEACWEDFLNILLVLPVVLPDSWWVVTHPLICPTVSPGLKGLRLDSLTSLLIIKYRGYEDHWFVAVAIQ